MAIAPRTGSVAKYMFLTPFSTLPRALQAEKKRLFADGVY